MDILWGLIAVVVLILGTMFFVAAEFALVTVSRERVEREAEDGQRWAKGVLASLKTLSFQLSGAQLGITITSLLLGFIAEPTIARALEGPLETFGASPRTTHGIAIALGLLIATASAMVFGELVPKNLAIARPNQVIKAVNPALRLNNVLFRPLITFLNASANWTVRLFGIEPREEIEGARSLDELELLVRSSRAAGTIEPDEYRLLARSLDFGEKTVGDALIPRTAIKALPNTATLQDMAAMSQSSGHSRFPVYEKDVDDIVGIVHLKDLFKVPYRERALTPVTDILQDTMLVPESLELEPLLVSMRRGRKQLVIVLDEYGGTAGIVSIEDILEEIVGEIEDEHDENLPTPLTEPMPKGVFVLSGLLHDGEVEEQSGFVTPEGPYDTLAGFLLSLFNRIPDVGEHVEFEGWEFKIIEKDKNRVAKVLAVGPKAAKNRSSEPES